MKYLLGVDTGGTFTDFVLLHDGQLRTHKVLSTPQAPEQAILQGIAELGIDVDGASIVHGSTVATNAVLERKGVRTAYVTNHGLRDVLSIGRQARKSLYDLQPPKNETPVPRELCFSVAGRVSANGELLEELDDAAVESLYQQIEQASPRAIAINLLFSFLNPELEKKLERRLRPLGFVCRSSQVLPEYKEYERGIATWLNAYVGPLMQDYLQRLQQGVASASLSVMRSSGGTVDAQQASKMAVQLLLSGPAGGLQGARYTAALASKQRLMTFDMGGTSTDVALIDREVRLTNEGKICGYPVAVPMVDMHTIGAGGGSIAWLDDGGMLQVGPHSAGANPGPACYGLGGQEPTVTDANLILGRLRSDAFLGGGMRLDLESAKSAATALAQRTEMSLEEVCTGILRIANEHMAQALRVISVQRGEDPRDYVLTCFGGAGGLHICDVAELLTIEQGLVPVNGGVLSALGMLVSPKSRDYSVTYSVLIEQLNEQDMAELFVELESEGRAALQAEGLSPEQIRVQALVDMRYRGQSYTLTVVWTGPEQSLAAFHASHERRYGHRLDEAVELVNIRIKLSGPEPELRLPELTAQHGEPTYRLVDLVGIGQQVPLYQREQLGAGAEITGPALIAEKVSTTWIKPGWRAILDQVGNLHLKRL